MATWLQKTIYQCRLGQQPQKGCAAKKCTLNVNLRENFVEKCPLSFFFEWKTCVRCCFRWFFSRICHVGYNQKALFQHKMQTLWKLCPNTWLTHLESFAWTHHGHTLRAFETPQSETNRNSCLTRQTMVGSLSLKYIYWLTYWDPLD